MTHLKKSLAMLLALIMMFSSMSVAASAVDTSAEEPSDITFTMKFFREDPKNPGQWIETTKAAPGENVKARLYIKTGFYTTGGDSCFLFDDTYFTPFHINPTTGVASDLEDGKSAIVSVNNSYAGPADDEYGPGAYGLLGNYVWRAQYTEWTKNMDYILDEIEEDAHYLDNRDIISHSIKFASGVNNSIYTDDDWVCEFNFKVNDNPTTNTIDSQGEAKVPPYYYAYDRTVTYKNVEYPAILFIDIPRGDKGDVPDNNITMQDWIPDFDSNPGTITTTSTVTFDMGLVDANGDWVEDTYAIEKGIISKDVDFTKVTNPTHPDGLEFSHWSTQKPAEGVTQDAVTTFSYDYDNQTLYAVWKEAADVTYTLKEYYMDAEGNYPTEVEGVKKDAAPDSTVSAPASSDDRFTLDATLSDFNVVVKSDNSSVVNAYYERNKYNLVYHYEDMSGEHTDTYSVRFGAQLPAFSANPSGEPDKTGYTFLGWTTTEGGTTVETLPTVMPAEELHLYPVYEEGETYDFEFIFDAKEGTFSDGNSIKRYSYKCLEDVITPEEPTAPGKVFVGWDNDIPEKADSDRRFEAIYEDEIYKVTFKADKDGDGVYETPVKESEFIYGEKLYTEYAPENYPIDAWKLEDGTAVEISDEETAYTVTGDTVLYTVGPDEYLAEFYLSQEDLDNGATPYHSEYVKYDEIIPVPDKPTVPGYNFIVWIPDVEGGLLMDSTDGKQFVAVLEPKDITVTFDANGGECDVTSTTVKYEESIEKLPEASRDGYEFLGWTTPDGTNVGTAGDSYAVPTEDVTLTAEWKAEDHKIIFLDKDGTELGRIENKTDEEIVVPKELNPPVKKGHNFTGWVDKDNQPAEVPETMPAEDMVLTATWETIYYDFNADANGGKFSDGSDKITAEKAYGDELVVEEPKMDGNTFLGWANADDESNTIITLPATMPDEALNIKAVWDTNKHDVYYDAMGGIFTKEEGTPGFLVYKAVEYGADIPVPANNPEKEGYTFVRWTPEKPEVMPDNELRFVAEWEKIEVPTEKEYTISVSYPNPANPEETITVPVITDSALPGTTVEVIKEGETQTKDKAHTYEEILANVKVEGIEPDYDNRPDSMTVTDNGGEIVVSFKLTEYTVTFNPNGGKFGESEEPVVLTGTYGQKVEAPANPAKEGHTFTGWDKTVPETFTEDVTVNATWDVQKHNAIFVVYDENGEEVEKITVEYEYDETIVAPEYEAPAGYEFNGWDIPAGTKMDEEDITFESTLEPVYYSLSYEISGLPEDKGVTAPATQNGLRLGDKPSVAKAPEVDGYTFDGWYDGRVKYGADGNDKLEAIENNTILTGTYSAIEYTITYDTDGAGSIAPEKYDCDEIVSTLPTVSKEGFEFLGWYDGETKVEAGFKMPARDIALTAKWSKDAVESTITFDANGGVFSNGDKEYSVTGNAGEAFTAAPADPTREGFKFTGWVDENGNATSIPATFPEKDVTIKASWEEIKPDEYTITFDSNGGSAVPSQTYKAGDAVVAPADPTREGFKFIKWNPELPETMPAENITVVAEWEEIVTTNTLVIDANGGEFDDGTDIKTMDFATGDEIKDLPVPTRDGFEFAGWSGIPEDGKMPAEDITIKAEWTPVATNEHKIEYYYAVDGALYTTLTFEEGEAIVNPAAPTVEGFTFKGWKDADGNDLPEVMGTEDLKAYAQFDINTYKVTYIVDGSVYEEYDVLYQAEVPVPTDPADSETRTFAGWEPEVVSTMPANDLTYTATWVNVPSEGEYSVTYLYHNGETYSKYVLSEGDEIPVPAGPQRFGYVFVGWEPEVPETMPAEDLVFEPQYEVDKTFVTIVIGGTVIAGGAIAGSIIGGNIAAITGISIVGGIIVIVGVVELVKHTHTVTFLVDGEIYKSYKVVEGTRIPVPADPVKDGFTFEGWNPEVPEKMGDKDLVFEATWAEVGAADDSTDDSADVDVVIPETGSVAGGITAFAVISGAAAAAYVLTRKKKED